MYNRTHRMMAAATFVFTLALYWLTMAGSVTFWDAGEFIAASYTLGVPHPPGTPLFMILGRVLSVLPLGMEVAAKLNFLSVLCGAFSAMFLYLIAARIIELGMAGNDSPGGGLTRYGGALAAALVSAFTRTMWSNTTEFEVYAVATASFLLCAWLMIYMGRTDDPARTKKVLLLVIYIVSLSIANHLLVLLVAPGVVVYTLLHDRRNWQYWASALGFLLGLYLMVLKGMNLGLVFARLDRGIGGSAPETLGGLLAAAGDVVFGIGAFIGSGGLFTAGLLVTAGSLFWAYRRGALGFSAAALGLFLLGFSIHAYLIIRAGLNPPINEGAPDTLAAMWSVIGRTQYGSSYGLLPRQVWTLVTGKTDVSSLAEVFENVVYFLKYNIPFYVKYFGWQFGGYLPSTVFFLLGVLGASRHYRAEKKSFYFWLTVFLITGPVLNTYLNFRFGHTQFPEVRMHESLAADEPLHEVRERDYFFIVSFVFYGMWAGLGLAWLAQRARDLLRGAGDNGGALAGSAATTLVLAASLLPLALNYDDCDRSGNRIPANYARNLLNSLEPDAIVFTNGDNDTFPLWYIQEVEGVRRDCRVVNLSLLNLDWYIRQMRDMEPRVPIILTDGQIDSIRATRFDREMRFRLDGIDITYPEGSVFLVQDRLLLHILMANQWEKPLYFTTSVRHDKRAGLTPYFTMEGITYRLNPRKAEELAAGDSSIVYIAETGVGVDVDKTRRLLYEEYDYGTFFREGTAGEPENKDMLVYFQNAFAVLGHAFQLEGDYDAAIDAFRRGMRFSEDVTPWLWLAETYALKEDFDSALAALDTLNLHLLPEPNLEFYQLLAQRAVNNRRPGIAERFLRRSIEIEPGFKEGYGNLFMLYDATGHKDQAAAIVEEYLEKFPADSVVRSELDRYRETGEFDIRKAFM